MHKLIEILCCAMPKPHEANKKSNNNISNSSRSSDSNTNKALRTFFLSCHTAHSSSLHPSIFIQHIYKASSWIYDDAGEKYTPFPSFSSTNACVYNSTRMRHMPSYASASVHIIRIFFSSRHS